jgi:uncharacterized iron-regulated membrane protein
MPVFMNILTLIRVGDRRMIKTYALRFHRWVALTAAVPLLVVIVTGLVLSFEPMAQRAALDHPLSKERVLGFLSDHDAAGKATGITIRRYDQTLTIAGVGEDGAVEIDLRTGKAVADDNGWSMSEVFRTSRRLHETLLLDMEWLVIASTFAMLAIGFIGLFMGLPRLRNTLGGWHSVSAWVILPLAIISPLTGLAIAYGVTLLPANSGPRPAAVPIRTAVEMIADKYDLADMTSLRTRGGRLVARIYDGPYLTGVAVRADGLQVTPTNWPRAIHEGNWHAWIGGGLNVLASIVFIGLWFTGLMIWSKRKLRRRQPRDRAVVPQPAE